ncbi:class I SAM-dependent methyltransferase [Streptomyces sp. NPDC005202]|uniref:class I SAM-dependent DNA methyltransferase n=1 Tax=Streptomyces sp. NPDC005202 TaxID=3157021 RepID=UPI0033A4177A
MSASNADSTPDFLHATRASYDAMAHDYADRFPDGLADKPLDRALLTAFADLVRTTATATRTAPSPVADLGSGPGHVTARLHALGLPVFGVDLSPRMVALARRTHPGLRFHVGSMTSLDLQDETLAGIAALYSIIHIPTDRLPPTFAEFHRTLLPGGCVLLAFQAGDDDHLHLSERFGHDMSLDYYFRAPDAVAGTLAEAGFELHAKILREPNEDEKRPRAFILARKPPPPAPETRSTVGPASGSAATPR